MKITYLIFFSLMQKSAAKWIGVDGATAVWKALKVYNCK